MSRILSLRLIHAMHALTSNGAKAIPVTEIYILVPHFLRYVLWFARYFQIPYIPTYPAIP